MELLKLGRWVSCLGATDYSALHAAAGCALLLSAAARSSQAARLPGSLQEMLSSAAPLKQAHVAAAEGLPAGEQHLVALNPSRPPCSTRVTLPENTM